MKNYNHITKAIALSLVLALLLCLCACGAKVTKKTPASLRNETDNESYSASFEQYFETGEAPRYIIEIVEEMPDTANGWNDNTFHIFIKDTGEGTASFLMVYTSGAESESPTIVNPIFTAGKSEVSNAFDFNCTETDPAKRADAVINTLCQQLEVIEGD
jgi:hypothetical protein